MDDLPFVDEHRVLVKAPALVVWRALTGYLPRFASGGTVARLLATEPRQASGTSLTEGATLPYRWLNCQRVTL